MNVKKSIASLKESREELERAQRNYEDATRPILKDLKDLETVYRVFLRCVSKQPGNIEREQFLFIAQVFFCPDHLFGGKFPNGFRRELAHVTGICPTVISDICKRSLFRFELYYKQEIENLFPLIIEELREKGVSFVAEARKIVLGG